MIHLPTAAGGRVEHLVPLGTVATRGLPLVRVTPDTGPPEEIVAPLDGIVERQRLEGAMAPAQARIVGITRAVVSTCTGRIRWIATLGPVGVTTLVALVDTGDAIRPHRAGTQGFVGRRYVSPGQKVTAGTALIEVRGEELV